MPVPSSKFGYLPDPTDTRDIPFRAWRGATEEIAPSVDFRPLLPGILDQDNLGSCVAQGVFGAIRLKHVLEGIEDPKLGDRLHMYLGARSYIGTESWDSGSHIRDAFRFANAYGYMPEDETVHGHDITKYNVPPTPEEQRVMSDQREKGDGQIEYVRIFESGQDRCDAIKRALSNRAPVVLGTDTTQAFLDYKSGVLPAPQLWDRSTGGHAFFLAGYDEHSAYGVNSWNWDYGEEGCMRLSWDYIIYAATRDLWAVRKAPYYSHLLLRS